MTDIPTGPAMDGATMTFEGAIYVRHGGVWVPLIREVGEFERIVERVALTSPAVIEEEARRWMP